MANESPVMTSYIKSIVTAFLSGTVFKILTILIKKESPVMISYLKLIVTLCLSGTVFKISALLIICSLN